MSDNEEFIRDFLVESEENLDQLDQDFVALEEDPQNPDRLASVFRTIHTIKGTSGFFGFSKLGAIAHAGEGLLSRLRAGEILLSADITTALLDLVDAIRKILGSIESDGTEGAGNYGPISSRLKELTESSAAPPPEPPKAVEPAEDESAAVEAAADPDAQPDEPASDLAGAEHAPDAIPPTPTETEPIERETELAIEPKAISEAPTTGAPTTEAETVCETPGEVATAQSPAETDEPSAETEDASQAAAQPTAATEGSIRVDVELLDHLMNLVGELVLARNQIRPFGEAIQDRVFANAAQQLDHIARDLQEGIMKTRMQPISRLWSKFPRVIRDIARTSEKSVQLKMQGDETELDRTVLDAIKDPLTHLIRNAVDHGIESPDQRRACGKPETGQVLLSAFHEGGVVNIEISDDGAGISAERVREKAVRLGLVARDVVRDMTTHQSMQLIFLPGLSTADQVTDISGRGVGMDVVKTNIDRIGGTITIQSKPDLGTMIRIQIPLTLAIIPALIVAGGGERFAIPQVSLREIITLYERAANNRVETVGESRVYRLRGELLPLVELTELFELPPLEKRLPNEFSHVVVLQAVNQRFGLIVNNIHNSEEIVVKPLHKALAPLREFSGATIMDDGRVALILDVVGLARSAGIADKVQQATQALAPEEFDPDAMKLDEQDEYLVCETSPGQRVAIPLQDVTRLEELQSAMIETTDGQDVIPYRDHLMPLLGLHTFARQYDDQVEMISTVVHAVGDRHVGLMVNRILDVSTAEQTIDESQQRHGILGRTLINGDVIEVINVDDLAATTGIHRESAGPSRRALA